MHLTEEARYVGRATAFEIPMPVYRQPGKKVHDLIMLGSLPPRVRELYGLRWSARKERAFRIAVRAIRAAAALAPRQVTHGWNKTEFDLVAETERRRIAAGKPTPQIVD
jgi:uncharacterized protein (DUF2236 family)